MFARHAASAGDAPPTSSRCLAHASNFTGSHPADGGQTGAPTVEVALADGDRTVVLGAVTLEEPLVQAESSDASISNPNAAADTRSFRTQRA
jgi:hypothetical protein